MAAVQYGPAAKTIDGLGFLFPAGKSFFQTVGEGIALAEALDRNITNRDRNGLLKDLRPTKATAKQTESMYAAWSILEPSKAEKEAFRRAFFNQATIGESNALGRRSTTIQLILDVLARSRGKLDVAAIKEPATVGPLHRQTVSARNSEAHSGLAKVVRPSVATSTTPRDGGLVILV